MANEAQTSAERAMDALRDELAKASGRPDVERVGEYLTGVLRRRPEIAGQLLAKGKSLAGAMEAVKAEARKRAVHGVACMEDEEVYALALKYYGIESGGPAKRPAAASPAGGDGLDLDALLG